MSAGTPAPRGLRRLFFAIVPDDDLRAAIVRATRSAVAESKGRAVPAANLHVTVVFLGAVDAERQRLAASALPIQSEAFDLKLSRLSYWRRGRILWLEPLLVPAALTELETSLWTRLADLGFERETRPFRPHLTLARRAQSVTGTIAPILWPVRALSLVESIPIDGGVEYVPLQSWAL